VLEVLFGGLSRQNSLYRGNTLQPLYCVFPRFYIRATQEQPMSDHQPIPPTSLPAELVDTLNKSTPEQLRDVATYAEELAELKERETYLEEEPDQDEAEERPDDLPDDTPAKATITIKKINDNRYYYWQWRDGDQVKSKYKSPVNPDE